MWLGAILVFFLAHSVSKTSSFVNLAHTPAQSLQGDASWNVAPHESRYSADKAVDGNINQTYLLTCAVAAYANNYRSVWWKVWLDRVFNIAYLEIYLRSGTTNRAAGFSIYIYEEEEFVPPSGNTGILVYYHNPQSGCPRALQNITVNKLAQGVAFFNERPVEFTPNCSGLNVSRTSIEICEVRVMGCDQNRYHFGCTGECSAKCKDSNCDAFNGSCIYGCSDPGAVSYNCTVCDDGTYASNGRCVQCGHCKDDAPCDKATGKCLSGCKKNWKGDLCKSCMDNFFGQICENSCGNCKSEAVCDNITGICPHGCENHWKEPYCDVCMDYSYGANCKTVCGHCADGTICNHTTGNCPHGCEDHWAEPNCDECVNGFYGENCSFPCGRCVNATPCNKTNGACPGGCEEHWAGGLCNSCGDGYYDQNCSTECGNCLEGFCDKKNGSCLSGCKLNWQEPLCKECTDGYYDQNCSTQCGNCREEFCDKKNGSCLNGCIQNWREPLCQDCVGGFYDQNCSSQCGNCLEGFCDNKNGSCLNGCKQNWKDPLCQECVGGYYGQNCNTQCGNCLEGFCDTKNGSCLYGCKENWNEPLCQECDDGFFDQNCSTKCGNCKKGICDKKNGNCYSGCVKNWQEPLCQECENGFYDMNCSRKCGHCRQEVCDKGNGSCIKGCLPNYDGPLCNVQRQEGGDYAAIIGGTVPTILIVVLAGIVIVIFYRRYRNNDDNDGAMKNIIHFGKNGSGEKRGESKGKENKTDEFDGVCNPNVNQSDEEGYYNTVQFNTNISIVDLRNVINEKSIGENNQFLQEYKKLPFANLSICQSAKKRENATKNRFKTTFPYEHSRIILKEIWEESDNDYINANFITDSNGERRYIAAQGPKVNTLRDFWRMIWQEDIKDIVMLTNIIENGKIKCTHYWPDKDKSMEIGPCKISLLRETVYAFHTVRKISVERKHSPSKRIISQYHYTAWPDHGTPEEVELVQFYRVVAKKMHTDVPLLVHCSAGVGRTGTFIGLDSLLRQGRETGRINVFEFVKQMRENRMTMVQTPEQYVFLHEALICGFQNDTLLTKDEFASKAETLLNENAPLNEKGLYKEFKLLLTLIPTYDRDDEDDARKAENISKNYSKDILPVSKYRPYLTSYVKGRNDYINAVMVSSFINPNGLILTQKPLSDTEVDLWRLCCDHEVDALVVLNVNHETNDWLPRRGFSKACPPFTLSVGDTGSNINGVSQDSLVISSENTKKEIELLQIQAENNDALVKGTEILTEQEKGSSFTSVIMSKDGAGTAGIFCVLHNGLQQINVDGEVDIFTIVRQLKIRRPEVITKLEEYRKCYQLVSESVSTEGIYANM